ncbi:HAD family hydrolase [bacterium]|nr:HAD family hydrolase [bacterium]
MKKRAIFLDRDGTVTKEIGYINHVDNLELIPDTGRAIKLINDSKFLAILTTNQAGVARGYFTEKLVIQAMKVLDHLLIRYGAKLDAKYYCPHHPEVGPPEYRVNCNCRKPKPGMILDAAEKFDIDISTSYMIGDRSNDIEFGHNLGMKTVLVLTGYGKGEYEYQRDSWIVKPDFIARDLYEAIEWILQNDKNN